VQVVHLHGLSARGGGGHAGIKQADDGGVERRAKAHENALPCKVELHRVGARADEQQPERAGERFPAPVHAAQRSHGIAPVALAHGDQHDRADGERHEQDAAIALQKILHIPSQRRQITAAYISM